MTQSRLQNDYLPTFLYGAFALFTSLMIFYLPVYFSERLGFTGAQIGLIFAAQAITGVLASFPAGLGNDRITSRTLAFTGLLMMTVFFLLMGLVKSFVAFWLVYFGWALFNSLFRTSLDVQVLKTDTGDRTGQRIGLYQTGRFGGMAVGIILAGYLATKLDFKYAFFFMAGVTLVLSVFTRFLAPTKIGKVRLADYKADITNPRMMILAVWLYLFSTHWGAEHTCYSLFLRKSFDLSFVSLGWFMSAEFFAITASVLLVGRWMTTGERARRITIVGLLCSGIGHIGMIFPPVLSSVAFRAMHGVGDGLIFLVFYVGIAKLFNVERMGGNTGLVYLITMLGMITGALISGPVGEAYGYQHPLWVSGVIMVLLALPILALPWIRRKTVS